MVKIQLYISPKVELMEIDEEGSMMTTSAYSAERLIDVDGDWDDE